MNRRIENPRGFGSLLRWLPWLAGGVAALAWMALRQPNVGRVNLGRRRLACAPSSNTLKRLCHAIIGNNKAAVASVFGPPAASAGFNAVAPAILTWSDYQMADTWYYPLDRETQAALVVHFDDGVASDATLLHLPR